MKFFLPLFFAFLLLASCQPKRPEGPKEKPQIFYPDNAAPETADAAPADDILSLEEAVKERTASIFAEVLRLYNAHKYTQIDRRALTFCTESMKRKYKALIEEWEQLPEEEQEEYVEGPTLWWYFIGGNIDTRSGRALHVRKDDMEIFCLDKEMGMIRVLQKVSDTEFTYCKVFLRNVDGVWLIDDLMPESIGGRGYNLSFRNDHW